MKQENLAFLHDNLKYLGFGDGGPLYDQLIETVERPEEEFQLYTEAYFDENSKLEACLYFRKSDQHGMCFFNKYDALLVYPDEPERNRKQTFYINKGSGVTFKEAFNLLSGRSVNKDLVSLEGEKYNAWIQINFEEMDLHNNYRMKQYRLQYGYDLEKTLERYPIRELQHEETKATLIRSLRRGNVQLVSFDKTSKTEKMYIEANPRFKTINIYPASAMRAAQKNNRPLEPAPSAHPLPDPFPNTPDQEKKTGVGEELELMEETGEELEPAAASSPVSPTRKRIRR
jgi:hypothetical protein